MEAAVAVTYFHTKIGPMVYYCYPENMISEEEKKWLINIMDQYFQEGFFTHKFGNFTSLNYYFEIDSEWARGNKEMLMISLIVNKNTDSTIEQLVQNWAKDFVNKLRKYKDIYKAFYEKNNPKVTAEDYATIKEYEKMLKFWVKELYWTAIEELREKTEEEKWATIMSQPHIFAVIKKLAKGPMELEDFKEWFKKTYPEEDVNSLLKPLEEEKFIFINTIGQDTYILLVKDVSIERVPPNCIIDLEEESPELSDLTEIYINEVRDFFESYVPNPEDSLELFKLIAQPKLYNLISQLREGPLPREKILSMVSDQSREELMKNLELLRKKGLIQELSYMDQDIFLLKSDIMLKATFPEYLRKILPKETKGYIARSLRDATRQSSMQMPKEEIQTIKQTQPPYNIPLKMQTEHSLPTPQTKPQIPITHSYEEHNTQQTDKKIHYDIFHSRRFLIEENKEPTPKQKEKIRELFKAILDIDPE